MGTGPNYYAPDMTTWLAELKTAVLAVRVEALTQAEAMASWMLYARNLSPTQAAALLTSTA